MDSARGCQRSTHPSRDTGQATHRASLPLRVGHTVKEGGEAVSEFGLGDSGDVVGDLGVFHGAMVHGAGCPVVDKPHRSFDG